MDGNVPSGTYELYPGAESLAEIAPLPDMVRGYERIKLGDVAVYRSRLAEPAQ